MPSDTNDYTASAPPASQAPASRPCACFLCGGQSPTTMPLKFALDIGVAQRKTKWRGNGYTQWIEVTTIDTVHGYLCPSCQGALVWAAQTKLQKDKKAAVATCIVISLILVTLPLTIPLYLYLSSRYDKQLAALTNRAGQLHLWHETIYNRVRPAYRNRRSVPGVLVYRPSGAGTDAWGPRTTLSFA